MKANKFVLTHPNFGDREKQFQEIMDAEKNINKRVVSYLMKQVSAYKDSRAPPKELARGSKYSIQRQVNAINNTLQSIIESNLREDAEQGSETLIQEYNNLSAYLENYLFKGVIGQRDIKEVQEKVDTILPLLSSVIDIANNEEFEDVDVLQRIYDNIKSRNYEPVIYEIPEDDQEEEEEEKADIDIDSFEVNLSTLTGWEEQEHKYTKTLNAEQTRLIKRANKTLEKIGKPPLDGIKIKTFEKVAEELANFVNKIEQKYADIPKVAPPVYAEEGGQEEGGEEEGGEEEAGGEVQLEGGARYFTTKLSRKQMKNLDNDEIQQRLNLSNKNPRIGGKSKKFHISYDYQKDLSHY